MAPGLLGIGFPAGENRPVPPLTHDRPEPNRHVRPVLPVKECLPLGVRQSLLVRELIIGKDSPLAQDVCPVPWIEHVQQPRPADSDVQAIRSRLRYEPEHVGHAWSIVPGRIVRIVPIEHDSCQTLAIALQEALFRFVQGCTAELFCAIDPKRWLMFSSDDQSALMSRVPPSRLRCAVRSTGAASKARADSRTFMVRPASLAIRPKNSGSGSTKPLGCSREGYSPAMRKLDLAWRVQV